MKPLDRLKQQVAMWEPHVERVKVTRDNLETVDITDEQREKARELLSGCATVIIPRLKKGASYVARCVPEGIVYWVESEEDGP